ncbi:MAG: D-tyrosyl-tRNA(Tyr) deacylase [Gammaproteobacteria bacterium]|nr:D-tyrosyl-tRNA(Tyr) deacylase [Gammaproteobacteria bacterium]
MRVLLQRVARAAVTVDQQPLSRIGAGLLVLIGIAQGDGEVDADRLATKTLALRIFPDSARAMNRSVVDVNGEVLVVSQFTLTADTRRGNRPGFTTSAPPAVAQALYERYVAQIRAGLGRVATGRFGADMQVELVNDGPVTFLLES